MKKKVKVTLPQFLAMVSLEVSSNFIMEFKHDKVNNGTTLDEYFEDEVCFPHEYVSKAFPWDHTIKGLDYWLGVYRKMKADYGGQYTFTEFMELLEPIDQHRLNNAIEHQRGEDFLDRIHSDEDCREDAEDWLAGVINWEETEQGHQYWASIYGKIMLGKNLNEPSMLN
jgi:hypothetical protein